jgi:hypothetical protein
MNSLDGEFIYRDETHFRRNLSEQVKRNLAEIIGLDAIFASADSGLSPHHALKIAPNAITIR